jgi:FixJ family two-component response regulator
MQPIVHIVDDDKSFRTMVGRSMAASGFRAASYGYGDEILSHLPISEPDACSQCAGKKDITSP